MVRSASLILSTSHRFASYSTSASSLLYLTVTFHTPGTDKRALVAFGGQASAQVMPKTLMMTFFMSASAAGASPTVAFGVHELSKGTVRAEAAPHSSSEESRGRSSERDLRDGDIGAW